MVIIEYLRKATFLFSDYISRQCEKLEIEYIKQIEVRLQSTLYCIFVKLNLWGWDIRSSSWHLRLVWPLAEAQFWTTWHRLVSLHHGIIFGENWNSYFAIDIFGRRFDSWCVLTFHLWQQWRKNFSHISIEDLTMNKLIQSCLPVGVGVVA